MLLLTLLLATSNVGFVADPCGSLVITDASRAALHSFLTGSDSLDVALREGTGVIQQSATIEVLIASDSAKCDGPVAYIEQNFHQLVADTAVWNGTGWEHRVLAAGEYQIVVLRILSPLGTEFSSPHLAVVFKDEIPLTILMI